MECTVLVLLACVQDVVAGGIGGDWDVMLRSVIAHEKSCSSVLWSWSRWSRTGSPTEEGGLGLNTAFLNLFPALAPGSSSMDTCYGVISKLDQLDEEVAGSAIIEICGLQKMSLLCDAEVGLG